MSFEPVTRWHLRCDGSTTRGQCATLYTFWDPEDDERDKITALLDEPSLKGWHMPLRSEGWEVLGDRVLCPKHVDAAAQMANASLNGLPFDGPTAIATEES